MIACTRCKKRDGLYRYHEQVVCFPCFKVLEEMGRQGQFLWVAINQPEQAEAIIQSWTYAYLLVEIERCIEFLAQQRQILVTCAEEDFADVAEDYRLAHTILYSMEIDLARRARRGETDGTTRRGT